MEEDLEKKVISKIESKRFSFSVKDMKWVITSLVALVLWIVTAALWVKDKDKQTDQIKNLQTANSTLKNKVATLEGKVEGVSEASKIFMVNSPSENRFRLELVEKRVDRLELPGSNPPPVTPNVNDTTNAIRREH